MAMTLTPKTCILVALVLFIVPLSVRAQDVTLSGTVVDSTGGVLPGVAIRAVHTASGNTFETVTDARGGFRLPVRIGRYELTAQLDGFAPVIRPVELLVGQQAVFTLQMSPSGVEQLVTVTTAAPLVDLSQSELGGAVDSRQVSELPVNGRNWLDLTMLAPGSRANEVGETPLPRNAGALQINVDGQQVTQTISYDFGQPRFSRDAIAEFELVANRFDATQGRSSMVQVNAVTKSGTNAHLGMLSGYFRDDKFNAADFLRDRVLPYSNQQVSAIYGGPIRRDRIHYFANYEFEREPQTFTYTTPFPKFNLDLSGTRRAHTGGLRLDFQPSPRAHLTVRATKYANLIPYDARFTGGATSIPASAESVDRHANEIHAALSQVLSARALNQLRLGYAGFYWFRNGVVDWPGGPATSKGPGKGTPQINFRGFRVGQNNTNLPALVGQDGYSFRDDFTVSFDRGGRHDLKLGGEYIYVPTWSVICANCVGTIDAQGGPIPADIEALFPVWNDVSTWNLAALSPIVRAYARTIGDYRTRTPRHVYGTWVQDDWSIAPRMTLNLGVRYDVAYGMWAEQLELAPFLAAGRPTDIDNIAPRLGFVFRLNDRSVIRGGFGKFFAEVSDNYALWVNAWNKQAQAQVFNDGRPDFASNPFNGPPPSFQQVVQLGIRRSIFAIPGPNVQVPYSNQASLGMQHQLGSAMAVQADYVFTGGRQELFAQNVNLNYNATTGANYPFSDVRRLPFPDWGVVSMVLAGGRSNYHALQTAFTKRFSHRWQGSATYLLSALSDADAPPYSGLSPVTFLLQPDLGAEYSLAATDQRHRAVFNGIWEIGHGFQLSGLYFFGSGMRFATTYGADLRARGASDGRLRPDGTLVPRNNFVGRPLHRVDLRIQRQFRLIERASVDGILEVFNLFNRENYGSYVTRESNPNFGRPVQNTNVAYQPRILQLGFRLRF